MKRSFIAKRITKYYINNLRSYSNKLFFIFSEANPTCTDKDVPVGRYKKGKETRKVSVHPSFQGIVRRIYRNGRR